MSQLDSPPPLYTCSDIARIIGRTPTSIWRSVIRLKIKARQKVALGRICLYDDADLALIRANLRTTKKKS